MVQFKKTSKQNLSPAHDAEEMLLGDYLSVYGHQPSCSRPISIGDRTDEVKSNSAMLQAHGIDVDVLLYVLNAIPGQSDEQRVDANSIEQHIQDISMQMLKAIHEDREAALQSSGHTVRRGAALPDSVINNVTLALFDQIISLQIDIPTGLQSLLQIRLDPKTGQPNRRSSTAGARAKAVLAAAQKPNITTRDLATKADIDQSTATRWKNDKSFEKQVSGMAVVDARTLKKD